ncbi:MAG: hypothetical protein GTN40_05410 [Candidatus Aenigmarchaeota archaeon]|nr:hypothetical protein [Candidatus Aenigmarchaeota archaeon]
MFRGYSHKNVLSDFRNKLSIESKKVSTWPFAVKVVQEVGEDYNFSLIFGVGDMHNPSRDGGYGHVPDYFKLKEGLKKKGRRLNEETYKEILTQTNSRFGEKGHKDFDLVGVANFVEDRNVFTNSVLNALQQRFREEISDQPFFRDIEIQKYFDFRPDYVFKEDEFLSKVKEQRKIVETFPYGKSYVPTPNSDNPINVEVDKTSESVRIFTKRVPVTVTHIHMSPSREKRRRATVIIEPRRRISEWPLRDIFETGRNSLIYLGDVGRDLKEELAKYQNLTGLPRNLASQVKVFETYAKDVLGLSLGDEVRETVISSKRVLEELKLPELPPLENPRLQTHSLKTD